jgi:hypothetical protein
MKHFIILFFLLPLLAAAQDCGLKKGLDPITSKPTLSSGFIDLPGGTTLSIDVSSKEIDFFFVINSSALKCLDENTELTVIYEGGKLKSPFKNSGSMNCDGIFHIIFKNSAYLNSQLQKLGAKKVVSFRLTGSNGKPVDINLSPDLQQNFMKLVNCVVAESKTIL